MHQAFGLPRVREGIWFVVLLVLAPAMFWLLARHVLPLGQLTTIVPGLCRASVLSASSLLAALVAYPVIEEYLFRRVLCEFLEGVLSRRAAARRTLLVPSIGANLLSSLLFVLAHIAFHGLLHGIAVVLPSLVLGAVYLRYRSLLLNTSLHTYWNGLLLLFCR